MGNNRGLEYLWIKNCPNLTTLRYAHCGLKNGDAFIDWDSCRNLKTIDKYNCDGRIEWGNPEDEENEQKQEEFKRELNQELSRDEQTKKEKLNFNCKILDLIASAEAVVQTGDWFTVQAKLRELKQYAHAISDPQLRERLLQLEQSYANHQTTSQSSSSADSNLPLPLVIGVGLMFISSLIGILLWRVKKLISR
ncbi:MAG: hypothetical protein mread185_000360 [Mycoplasmataceae bacterium]|nr:MAG: hypothetical protein mread185_000360 [Mycoplasmataceae bacterium]